MKKLFSILTVALLAVAAVSAQTVLKVGATPEPHAEILNLIKNKKTVTLFIHFLCYTILNGSGSAR